MFHDYVIIFNLHIVWFGLLLILTLLAAADIIYTQRDETDRTLLWLLLLATQPVIGFLLYILFGRSRKDTVGRRIAFSAVEFRRKIRSRTKTERLFFRHRRVSARLFPFQRYIQDITHIGSAASGNNALERE